MNIHDLHSQLDFFSKNNEDFEKVFNTYRDIIEINTFTPEEREEIGYDIDPTVTFTIGEEEIKAATVEEIDALKERLTSAGEFTAEQYGQIYSLSPRIDDVLDKVQDFGGVKTLVQKVQADNIDALRNLGDQLRDKINGAVVLAAEMDGKAVILAMATKEAVVKGIHAGNIVKEVAKLCGGGGGGRPDMAQAGAKDLSKLDNALKTAWDIIKNQVK